jgi:hypothetical protein
MRIAPTPFCLACKASALLLACGETIQVALKVTISLPP